MPLLQIRLAPLAGLPHGALLELGGLLQKEARRALAEQVDRLQAAGTRLLILDLKDVRAVDSSSIEYLVRLADSLETGGGGLALIRLNPKVQVIFDLLGLGPCIRSFPSLPKALVWLGQAGPDPGAAGA